eukprot:15225966-Ditylum_brightwellii.AAC.1
MTTGFYQTHPCHKGKLDIFVDVCSIGDLKSLEQTYHRFFIQITDCSSFTLVRYFASGIGAVVALSCPMQKVGSSSLPHQKNKVGTKPAIRPLARRGGVKRISGLIYEETR